MARSLRKPPGTALSRTTARLESSTLEETHRPVPRAAHRDVPKDESHPRVRGTVRRAVPVRPHPGRDPHLPGPGGCGRRSGVAVAPRRLRLLHAPGARPRPCQGRGREAVHGRTHGQGHRVLPGPGRLHAHRRHEPGYPRRERHRRRRYRAGRGIGSGLAHTGQRARDRLLLRRRGSQRGDPPRGVQSLCHLAPPLRVPLREQPLRHERPGGRDAGAW